jgi:hypothetical protein
MAEFEDKRSMRMNFMIWLEKKRAKRLEKEITSKLKAKLEDERIKTVY